MDFQITMQYHDYFTSIKEKTLEELSLEELAFIHLSGFDSIQIKGGWIMSVLPAVIGEIRHAKHQRYSRNFIPIAAAFTVLEQLGFCYSRNDMPAYSNPNASPIKKSLYYFCNFAENDTYTKAIYALRNGFLHTASLVSKGLSTKHQSYIFNFDRNLDALIVHPEESWNGDFDVLQPHMATLINPTRLIDMIENTVNHTLKLFLDGKINVECPGGPREFYYRFLRMNRDS